MSPASSVTNLLCHLFPTRSPSPIFLHEQGPCLVRVSPSSPKHLGPGRYWFNPSQHAQEAMTYRHAPGETEAHRTPVQSHRRRGECAKAAGAGPGDVMLGAFWDGCRHRRGTGCWLPIPACPTAPEGKVCDYFFWLCWLRTQAAPQRAKVQRDVCMFRGC